MYVYIYSMSWLLAVRTKICCCSTEVDYCGPWRCSHSRRTMRLTRPTAEIDWYEDVHWLFFCFFLVFAWNDSSCTWAFMCKTNMFVNSKEKEYEEEVLELQPGAAPLLFPLSFPAAIHRFLWYLSHSHSSGTIPIYAIWNPMQFYIILFQICKNHFPTAWPCEIGNHEFIKWLQTIVFKCHYMDFTAATGCLAWKKEKRKNNH